jgi:transposase-like protein
VADDVPAPSSLVCPFCARFAGRPVLASRRSTGGLNPRYGCAVCGVRFTVDSALMTAAIERAAEAAALEAEMEAGRHG